MHSYLKRFDDFFDRYQFSITLTSGVFLILIGLFSDTPGAVKVLGSNVGIFETGCGLFAVLMSFIGKNLKTKSASKSRSKTRRNFLLYLAAFLIPSKDRDFEIGNMIEIYEKDKKRFGQKRALKLLAFDVIKSIYPLVKRPIGVIARTVLRTLGLYKIYKMFFG